MKYSSLVIPQPVKPKYRLLERYAGAIKMQTERGARERRRSEKNTLYRT